MNNRQDRRSVRAPRWGSMLTALYRQELLRSQWFKAPTPELTMTGTRVALGGVDLTPSLATGSAPKRYEDCEPASESSVAWLNRELHRPSSSLNHRTAHFAGKPYHWRQDYTGQLKLAAGESPW